MTTRFAALSIRRKKAPLLGKCVLTLPLLDDESTEGLKVDQPDEAAIPQALSLTWQRRVKRQRANKKDAETGDVSRIYLKDDGACTSSKDLRHSSLKVKKDYSLVFPV